MTGSSADCHYTLSIGGMTCTGCARRIEQALGALDGVTGVVVNYLTGDAWITGDAGEIDPEVIHRAIGDLGYRVAAERSASDTLVEDLRALRTRSLSAWGLAVPVIALTAVRWSGNSTGTGVMGLELVIAGLALAFPGRSTVRHGLAALRARIPDSDTLVALAGVIAWFTGAVALVSPSVPSYAGLAVLIVALHGTAGYVEALGRQRHHGLVAEAPGRDANDSSAARSAQRSQPRIQAFTRQMESLVVPLTLGAAVFTLFSWLALPAMMEALGGRAASWFPWTPAADTSPWGMAIYAALAVLLVAGPGAFSFASPAAILAGIGVAASRGMSIRRGETMQHLRTLTILAFSRTGTLTMGSPKVVAVEASDGTGTGDVFRWAAAVSLLGDHPVARAIVEKGMRDRCEVLPVTDFQAEPGLGMRATVDGAVVRVGKERWLASAGVDTKPVSHILYRMQQEGKTVVAVSRGRVAVGVIGLADTLRPESVRAIRILKRMGIQCVLITGDSKATAAVIAGQAGIERVVADVLPGDKAKAVKRLKEETIRTVGMVGHGADDAGALAAADVGIVPGTGAGDAEKVGDVTLAAGDLMGVVTLAQLGKAAYHAILQNIGLAFGYNMVLLPLAMVGLIHPLLAVVLAALSALAVLGNAGRLRHFDPEKVTKEVLRR